jgi:hypothetical protein
MYTTHSHTLPLHSVFYAYNPQAHMLIFLRREETGDPGENPCSIGENNTSHQTCTCISRSIMQTIFCIDFSYEKNVNLKSIQFKTFFSLYTIKLHWLP